MRVLITCHNGYIGSVLAPLVRGTPWRPLVHIEHIARAFIGALHTPGELVHNEAFHLGRSEENYRVRDLGSLVEQIVPGSLRYAEGGGPDQRCYRVGCSKLVRTLSDYRTAAPDRALAEVSA